MVSGKSSRLLAAFNALRAAPVVVPTVSASHVAASEYPRSLWAPQEAARAAARARNAEQRFSVRERTSTSWAQSTPLSTAQSVFPIESPNISQ